MTMPQRRLTREQLYQRMLTGKKKRPYDFNKFAVGNKHYSSGAGPNTGKALDRSGYLKRSSMSRGRMRATLRKLQAAQKGNYFSPEWLRKDNGRNGY